MLSSRLVLLFFQLDSFGLINFSFLWTEDLTLRYPRTTVHDIPNSWWTPTNYDVSYRYTEWTFHNPQSTVEGSSACIDGSLPLISPSISFSPGPHQWNCIGPHTDPKSHPRTWLHDAFFCCCIFCKRPNWPSTRLSEIGEWIEKLGADTSMCCEWKSRSTTWFKCTPTTSETMSCKTDVTGRRKWETALGEKRLVEAGCILLGDGTEKNGWIEEDQRVETFTLQNKKRTRMSNGSTNLTPQRRTWIESKRTCCATCKYAKRATRRRPR